VALRPVTVPGGLGAHKWQDRRLLLQARERAALGPDEHLLILDGNGDVLETDRANVFAVIDGVLHTPPADGRLLPGITRAAILRLARRDGIPVRETQVSSWLLVHASEVFVTNSVHGVMPVSDLTAVRQGTGRPGAGTAWPAGPLTARLQAGLGREPASPSPPGTSSPPPHRPPPPHRAPPHRPPRSLRRGGRPAIILIDHYDSFTYNLAHLLLGNQCQVEVVRNDEVSVPDIGALNPEGIVISPGPGTPADAGISIGTVRACGSGTPLLGVCLGHQAIAAAYGAAIVAAPRPVHGQASAVTHDGRGLLAGLPQGFSAARYHSLIVEENTMPPDLLITARGPGGIPMGLRHARHPAEGLQFHPESILTPHGDAIIRNFIRTISQWHDQPARW
jgi:anthranilate synthase/aminodeoxychorismate synthase-like glutamine amidotransferase